ncbi:hypothetical protein VQ042_23140 [Aurantimonas sp. A2-1-M11]|uniref:hypothetical protein n=1 Tax=Aurantimonas sp. A2-1-M11 TaxID=3113712 RepID=UPI002F9549BC
MREQTDLPLYFASVFGRAREMEAGQLTFVLPDGRRFRANGARHGPTAELHVHDSDLFVRLIREGDLGFSEAYLRIPTKPAMHSKMKPATCSDFIPAAVPI